MTRLRGLALLSVVVLATALSSWAGVFVSVAIGPPALPVYSQPLCPGPGYIWTPGYWAYGPAGYYWVPGTWVLPPQVGFLWTPGYWAFSAGLYNWHPGYWGPTVGFYGGINYGFGYTGFGYWGGYWRGNNFYYNRTVNNVNITNIHNVYTRTVVNNYNVNRMSYNGGPGGIQARATSEQLAAERDRHIGATSAQVQHEQLARNDRTQFASVNHGQQAVGATSRPGDFNAREATRANQQSANRPMNANPANNGREVPRPPQNNQQARGSWNVPRPPQSAYSQQRTSVNVPRPQNNQQQARVGNVSRPGNYTRPAAPQARNIPRPATMQRRPAPQYRAPSQHQASASHAAPSRAQQGGRRH
jgi:WXXGXW repeat (2 copies)